MVGRHFLCAMALIAALPAAARDGDRYVADADSLALLLADANATYGTIALPPPMTPLRYNMGGTGVVGSLRQTDPVDLAGFDELDVSLIAAVAGSARHGRTAADARPGFSLYADWERTTQRRSVADTDGGRLEVRRVVNRAWTPRPPRALDATLVLLLDGRSESPALSVGGGVTGAIWRAIPKE